MIADQQTQILVVDDEPSVGRLVAHLLHRLGFEQIDAVTDGLTALKAMAQTPYRIVISDFQMEPMSGLDLLKAIRASGQTKDTYFLMMAGGTEVHKVTAAWSAGMDGYLLKPFKASVLQAKINDAFQSKRLRA